MMQLLGNRKLLIVIEILCVNHKYELYAIPINHHAVDFFVNSLKPSTLSNDATKTVHYSHLTI